MTKPSNDLAAGETADKETLYGEFLRGRREDRRLLLQVARKHLDIDEDVQLTATKTGIGALGIAGIVAAAGLPTLVMAAAMLCRPAATITPPPPVQTVIEKVWDSSVDMIVEPPTESR